MEKAHKILIADRFPLHREGLKIALSGGPNHLVYQAHCVNSIAALKHQVTTLGGYHLLILDCRLLEQESHWTLQQLVSETCIPTLLMCDQLSSELLSKARTAGIRGVAERSTGIRAINQAAKQILDGKTCWPELTHEQRLIQPNRANSSVTLDDLTRQQQQIVKMIIDGKLNKQISFELGIHESTVKYHLTNIYKKFQVRSRTQLVVSARYAGADLTR